MGFFKTFAGSFHSAALYGRIRAEGHYAFGYSFLLVALTTLLMVIYGASIVHRIVFADLAGQPAFDAAMRDIARQMPTMTYHQKTLRTDAPGAHTLLLDLAPFGGHERIRFATIDTSGATSQQNAKTPLLVTAQDIIYLKEDETRIHPLTKMLGEGSETLVINRATIDSSAAGLIRWVHENLTKMYLLFGGMVWLALVLFYYVARLLALVVVAAVAALVMSSRGRGLAFSRLMALAAVSFTPVAVADLGAVLLFGHGASVWLLLAAGGIMLAAALYVSADDSALAASA